MVMVHQLYCPVITNSKKEIAKIYVTENLKGDHKFYLTKIEEIPSAKVFQSSKASSDPRAKRTAGDISSEVKVADVFDFVKKNDVTYEADSGKPRRFSLKLINSERSFFHCERSLFKRVTKPCR